MKALSDELVQFFHKQGFVIVSTIDKAGSPHNSCKGIVKINKNGQIYLLDLYNAQTFENLKDNPNIAITAVDEHKFKGFSLKGKARLIKKDRLASHVITAWEKRIAQRITKRVLKNVAGERGHRHHPEAALPKPEYMIVMDTEKIVDLTPAHLK